MNLNGGNIEDQLFPPSKSKAALTRNIKPEHLTYMEEINTINTRPGKLRTNPEEEIKMQNDNMIKKHVEQRRHQLKDVFK